MKAAATKTIETITPEVAATYLAMTERRAKSEVVDIFAEAMRAGSWNDGFWHDASPIAFDEDGQLVDGVRRLEAVVQAQTPVEFIVLRGIPRQFMDRP